MQTLTPPAVTHTPTSQAGSLSARIAELLRPAAFPHPAPDPRVIETHISWVILAGDFAYKLRKPVDFGFLDFSTLEQRQADCEAEVRLNRRLCPDLYLSVVDVVERDGQLSIAGLGIPVEPAVLMRRLPEAACCQHCWNAGWSTIDSWIVWPHVWPSSTPRRRQEREWMSTPA